jgi:hypothetical protein
LRDEYTRNIEPAHALAAETLRMERLRSAERGIRSAEYPAEIELLWQTAPPRMPIPPPTIYELATVNNRKQSLLAESRC